MNWRSWQDGLCSISSGRDALIALLPFIVRALSTRQSARLRYGTACLALLMMAVTPPITFSVLEGQALPPADSC